MTELPPVTPNVVAETVDALAGRLRRRAEELAADREHWTTHHVEGGLEVDLGEVVTVAVASADESVAEAQQVRCRCLLAPRCAHRAAVLLAAPVRDSTEAGRAPASRTPDRDGAGQPVADVQDDVPTGRRLGAEQRRVLELVHTHLSRFLLRGAHRADPEIMGELGADLQLLRAHRLVVAERALTGALNGVPEIQDEATARTRTALASAMGTLALNVHSLLRADMAGAVDDDLIGRDRQVYRPVGGLTLHPVCAEPVRTGSGFAGVVITFIDAEGRVWTLRRVAPEDVAGVGQRYAAGVDWGGLSCDMRTLSRSTVIVAGATASTTGSLGGGRGPRASLAAAAAPAWERLCSVDDRWQVLQGEIAAGPSSGLLLDTADGRENLQHSAAAARDSDGLALLARARGARVQVLVRADGAGQVARGIRPLDDRIVLPDELNGHMWPGLDLVRRQWFGDLPLDEPTETFSPIEVASWVHQPSTVREVMERWSVRTVLDGADAVRGSTTSLERDARGLRAAGAPFGADLLDQLGEAARREMLAGTTLAGDGPAFLRSWLAVNRY